MNDITNILKNKIMVFDGAMGTMLQSYNLTEKDFRGERFKDHTTDLKGNNDFLCIVRPDIVLKFIKLILIQEPISSKQTLLMLMQYPRKIIKQKNLVMK
tara:strand:+ start:1588 stop:1884 length:297 start_codon:yes stop_codon:yes gene_type:complete